jgi:hypothetical protein
MPGAQCSLTPANPVAISANTAVTLTVSVTVPNDAVPKSYNVNLIVSDASGHPSSSLQPPLALTVIEDFSLSSATSSQTVTAGQTTGAYQLSVAPNPPGSSFSEAVTLSCSPNGLPAGAECLFSPDTPQTPGSAAVNIVMTVATGASAARSQQRSGRGGTLYALWVLLPALMFSCIGLSRSSPKQKQFMVSSAAALLLILLLPSCSGVSSAGSGGGSGGNPTTYTVTIIGTSGSLSHSTSVKLIVQ